MEGKVNVQKTEDKEALVLEQRKHKFIKLKRERERARMLQRWSGAQDNSSFGSCSSSLAFSTDEVMSASSKIAKDVEEAVSESSWTALAKGKERDWLSTDLDGEVEKLEVIGQWSGTDGGSLDPKGKMGHWSARIKSTEEGSEEVKGAENEKQGSRTLREARFEIQSSKRKVKRVESQETQDHVRETLAIRQEEP